eukprot:770614_1
MSVSVTMIMGNKQAIHLFMAHLSSEYSMECLLAFIEISQYQDYLYGENIDNLDENNVQRVEFADNIPISEIIEAKENVNKEYNNIFLAHAKIKAHKLYNKYVKYGAEFEINISSVER